MSKKIEFTKEELKQKDALSQSLTKGFEWSAQHSRLALTLIALFLLVGGGYTVYEKVKEQTENKLKESYFSAEKKLNEIKKKQDEAQKKKDEESKKAADKKTDKSKNLAVAEKIPVDVEKDYAEPMAEFKKIIHANPSSIAASMAGLKVVEMYRQNNKLNEALDVLKPLTDKGHVNHLVSALVYKTKGSLLADLNQCPEALKTWEVIEKSKQASFLVSEVKLHKALCFEQMGQAEQAESLYKELSSSTAADVEDSVRREAERSLRLMKLKKAQL